MASKLPNYILELDILIKRAGSVYMATDIYQEYPLISHRTTLAEYKKWSYFAHKFFDDYKSIISLPLGFFEGDSINIAGLGLIPSNKIIFSDPEDEKKESQKSRSQINTAIGRQIEMLKKIRETLISKNNIQKYETITISETPIKNVELEEKTKISKTIKKIYPDLDFKPKNGKGLLQFKKGGKVIELGKYNTRTYKMVDYLLHPTSKSKKVIDVYEYIKILKDNKNEELQKNTSRSYQLKKEIIEACVNELQKKNFLKGHITKPIFDDIKKEVVIKFK